MISATGFEHRKHRRARWRATLVSLVVAAVGTASLAVGAGQAVASTSQTIAAGTSATNLPTESVWPGAQNPPYICCWGSQGQYVTFSFTVAAASTGLALRYSAGNGVAYRKVELDGAVTVAKQSFPATSNWSTWATVTLTRTLTAGTHTLKIWWDGTAGSAQYLNLDNLTVTQASPPGVPVVQTPPSISGVTQQGQTLTASTGTWTNSPSSFAYVWNRCNPSCAPTAVTTSTYALGAADVGATMTVTVTASNTTGASQPATSPQTAVVTAPSSSQTIAAGTSATNLPTETTWPGAQNPPYICCWGSQGQYVTFSFNVSGGSTNLTLRYSAGNGNATRKIELDGVVTVANQTFPATSSWSSWATVTLNRTLSSGAHTLKIWWDSTAGSSQYLNLDNLTVSQSAPPPSGVVLSVGYADSATGLTPWQSSANTTFIGEPAQCCSTHGPDNGSNGYDAGAIEVANTGASSVTVNAVTVDFGGGSSPSHYDLWGGSTTPHLPQTLAPGAQLVLTMTSSFNFDTSDLFGEACHINSGVVPVVHVTLNGSVTDYQDSHQILNSDGADLASCPGDVSEQAPFTVVVPGAQPGAAPVNDIAPAISAAGIASARTTPVVGHITSGFAGGWNASPPPSLALQWKHCDTTGANCTPISGAVNPTYIPTAADVGQTLRLQVTASNATGTRAVSSLPTAPVQSGPSVGQLGHTVPGFTATFVNSTSELSWTEPATVNGTTNDFAFFARGAGNDQVFTPKIYRTLNGQKGSLIATGSPITVPKGTDGQWYVTNFSGTTLTGGTQYVFGLDPSGSYNGTYLGSETNGEPSFFVDFTPT